ncbi:MAG: 4Fe-4S binding protein [Paludibacteraceae bacterium]|jgi:NADH-quinone oxidoreductase subunit I|nr:4Fe-4S binding protein [Paludibacteraceae bacterium]
MKNLVNYIKAILLGIWNLLLGMKITMINFFRPKITEQYPENRGTQVMFERFRGELTMPHNANNEHKCTACGICQMNCPNGTITVISKQETDEATGKTKKVLDKYEYDLGSCIFCDLCVRSCPQDAIEWSQAFEHSVFTRSKLVEQLNHEGSKLAVKEKVTETK